MASYFELQPQDNGATAAHIQQVPADERKQLGRMSLMSPAVTQLLEDLDDEKSDSSSEGGSLFDEENLAGPDDKNTEPSGPSRQGNREKGSENTLTPSTLSPNRPPPKASSKKGSSAQPSGGGSARQKPTHMARFHSLRSMLFQANIEDKMKTNCKEETQKEAAATTKWKSQHDDRQMHRPKTPEAETVGKDGIGTRIRTKLRRITSKDVPTMSQISEDEANVELDDHASTASSDNESGRYDPVNDNGDTASINDSDIEELARWVSRGNSAGTRQAKPSAIVPELHEDSGHESMGQSDVDDLVRWVSRKSAAKEEHEQTQHTGYSDASTESDTELIENSSDEEEDADDLVRWISHRDGPRAGPLRRNLERNELDSDVERHYESDVPELGRWFKRHDGTSGESATSSPAHDRTDFFDEEEERGRPRSRASISPEPKQKNHLTEDDVDEIVRWVSRRDSKQQGQVTTANDEQATKLQQQEAKKKQLGMLVDKGSLSHSDLKEVIEHVRRTSLGEGTALKLTDSGTGSDPTLDLGDDDAEEIRGEEEAKKEQLGMTVDEGSLSHSDVQELLAHVRENDIRDDPVRVV
ncbi:hypothetical protein T440DRAFT_466199 [Plenodomus tracheiphilus IPT5]|uniref:Uncharacterized protein n=1 Tax=Plenodomus tracheiphilus IPT5 TaxID=1408161 RepID=A0A6A7BFF0_9PLEO|nr:hypothetical protein T440DRAFT_466199 [Plenodomus tracheiphilus IPT5]